MQIFPLSDLVTLDLAPSIMGSIEDYLHSVTQKIYINLRSADDRIDTKPLLELSIRRIPGAEYQYMSQVAHQLAGKLRSTPLEICQSLKSEVEAMDSGLEVQVWYSQLGYIYFQLTARSIVLWLEYIQKVSSQYPLVSPNLSNQISPESLSLAIYVHGRCCSVLRLARGENLVSVSEEWEITTLDWLDYPRDCSLKPLQPDRILIFELPVERRLIHTLMDVLDGFGSRRSVNWGKLVNTLARDWLEFDRYCQIFGDTKRQNPRLAIARCGLTAIVRRYLQVLLENYLGVIAPIEF